MAIFSLHATYQAIFQLCFGCKMLGTGLKSIFSHFQILTRKSKMASKSKTAPKNENFLCLLPNGHFQRISKTFCIETELKNWLIGGVP
jgi:hypothetical protein